MATLTKNPDGSFTQEAQTSLMKSADPASNSMIPQGATYISDPKQLSGLTPNQIYRDNSGGKEKIYKLPTLTPIKQAGTSATPNSPLSDPMASFYSTLQGMMGKYQNIGNNAQNYSDQEKFTVAQADRGLAPVSGDLIGAPYSVQSSVSNAQQSAMQPDINNINNRISLGVQQANQFQSMLQTASQFGEQYAKYIPATPEVIKGVEDALKAGVPLNAIPQDVMNKVQGKLDPSIWKQWVSAVKANEATTQGADFGVIGSDSNGNNIMGFIDKNKQTINPYNPSGDPSKIIGGYNFSTYATDPNWGNAVNGILSGKLKNYTGSIDQYIQQTAPNSPLVGKGQVIAQIANQYAIDPRMLLSIMEHESKFGTLGVAAKTFNPGNVGNVDSGATSNKGTWEAGIEALARNIAGRKMGNNGSNQDAAAVAAQIMDPNSGFTLNDVLTKNKAAVNTELIKLKSEALKKGDMLGVIRASAGGGAVDSQFTTAFDKTLTVLQQIDDLSTLVNKEATGPIMGILRSSNPYDVKAEKIKASLKAIVPNLARGVYGEVGVLTNTDIDNYSKTLPNLKSPKEVSDALLSLSLKSIQRSLDNKLKIQAASGNDVSGFYNIYKELQDKSTSLTPSTSVAKSQTNGDGTISKLDASGNETERYKKNSNGSYTRIK